MDISGIMVYADPEQWIRVLESIAGIEGVSLHQSDASSGKLVITIESESLDEQKVLLGKVKALSGVRAAELAYHYSDDEPEQASGE